MTTTRKGAWPTKVTTSYRKADLHVCHVLTAHFAPGVVYLEIDFNGTLRPEADCIMAGDDTIGVGFCAYSCDEKLTPPDGVINVEFTVPKEFRDASIYGQVNKRTWRGFIVANSVWGSRPYTIQWVDGVDKPKLRRLPTKKD
jgi:hypothetical protein